MKIAVEAVAIEEVRQRAQAAPEWIRETFSEREMGLVSGQPERRVWEFLAGRWAAKRAAWDLLPEAQQSGVEILRDIAGAPVMILARGPLRDHRVHVSIAHERKLALAFVVLEEECGQ